MFKCLHISQPPTCLLNLYPTPETNQQVLFADWVVHSFIQPKLSTYHALSTVLEIGASKETRTD